MSWPTSLLVNDIKKKLTEVRKWGINYCFLHFVHGNILILRCSLTKRTPLSLYVLWYSPSAQSTAWAAEG